MNRRVTYFILAALMPLSAGALTVHTVNVSSSDTGGVSVSAGEAAVTGGGEAYSEVRTVVTGNNGGGTANITVTTGKNGAARTETAQYDIPADRPFRIEAAAESASSGGRGSRSEVRVNGKTLVATSTGSRAPANAALSNSPSSSAASSSAPRAQSGIVQAVRSFLLRLVSLFTVR